MHFKYKHFTLLLLSVFALTFTACNESVGDEEEATLTRYRRNNAS